MTLSVTRNKTWYDIFPLLAFTWRQDQNLGKWSFLAVEGTRYGRTGGCRRGRGCTWRLEQRPAPPFPWDGTQFRGERGGHKRPSVGQSLLDGLKLKMEINLRSINPTTVYFTWRDGVDINKLNSQLRKLEYCPLIFYWSFVHDGFRQISADPLLERILYGRKRFFVSYENKM